MGTWNAYGNEYWPADYLIDAKGQVRYATVRRGRLRQDRNRDPRAAGRSGLPASAAAATPTRRGRALRSRHAGDLPRAPTAPRAGSQGPFAGMHDYGPPPTGELPLNDFAYSGTWNIGGQPAEASRTRASTLRFKAKNVYLVLSSPGERPAARCRCCSTGSPISAADSGADVHDGVVTVRRQRLYWLVSLPGDQSARTRGSRFQTGVAGLRLHVRLAAEPPPGARRLGRLQCSAMEGSMAETSARSWLRCYRCWSQDLEVQVHYEGIHKIDPDTGERAEVVDELQEAVVQCLDCMHDQPHLGFNNGRVEPIEDRWERMIAGTPWVASCTVTVDSEDVESCSGPEAGDALSYAAFGEHGVREFFTHVRFHKHEDDARIIVHLLVELYARSLEEATDVLESSARGALTITSLAEESRPPAAARRHPRPRLDGPLARGAPRRARSWACSSGAGCSNWP